MFKLYWKYLRPIALIYLCLFTGDALAALLPIAIPGSIIGMLLLFTLLSLQILPTKWVKPGCQLLIRYMVAAVRADRRRHHAIFPPDHR